MTDHVPLDHLTSDLYDALCAELDALRRVARGYCPACGRGDAAPTVRDWEQQRHRAEQAEAALAQAEAKLDRYADVVDVRGRCPACNWATLFLGNGGHVTCSRLECPDPSAADDLLHRSASTAELREDLERIQQFLAKRLGEL